MAKHRHADCKSCQWALALRADKGFLYNRFLKYFILPLLIAYCIHVMVVPYSMETLPATKENNATLSRFYYTSPEGLRMTLKKELGPTRLLTHSVAGVLMILACIFQKHSIPYLLQDIINRHSGDQQSSSSSSSSSSSPTRTGDATSSSSSSFASKVRWFHKKVVGPLMLISMSFMATAGFVMRTFSNLENFELAMIGFVAPWPILGLLIYFSAAKGYCKLHVIIGNALLWSCVAVIWARLSGACLQRLDLAFYKKMCELRSQDFAANLVCSYLPTQIVGLSDGNAYYLGIASSTVVFSLFLLLESVLYIRRCSEYEASLGENKRKEKQQ